MDIDIIRPGDFNHLGEIHNKFYKDEFNFGDLLEHCLCSFTAKENGQIITAGSIRTLVEIVAITDKSKPAKLRVEALTKLLHASSYVSKRNGYNSIHAFVQDQQWAEQLMKHEFRPTIGKALVTEV